MLTLHLGLTLAPLAPLAPLAGPLLCLATFCCMAALLNHGAPIAWRYLSRTTIDTRHNIGGSSNAAGCFTMAQKDEAVHGHLCTIQYATKYYH